MNTGIAKLLPLFLILAGCSNSSQRDSSSENTMLAPVIEQRIDLSEKNTAKIREIARRDYSAFVERLNDITISHLGFANRQELIQATIGSPIPQLVLNTSGVIQESQNVWRVPLLVDGKMRSLLTIEEVGGNLRLTDMGGAELAGMIGQIINNSPELFSGHRPYLLRSHQLQEDFLGPIELKDQQLINQQFLKVAPHNFNRKKALQTVDLASIVQSASQVQP